MIDDGLSEYSKQGLEETVNKYSSNASIQFLTVEKDIYEDFLSQRPYHNYRLLKNFFTQLIS